MKNIFSKVFIALFSIALVSAPLFADEAKVTFVKGKVEVNRNGGDWVPLKVGDLVSESDTISTGFQSEARLNLNGSVLAVSALSRVTLENFSTSDTKDNVNLYVNTGAVRSRVTHTAGKKIDYTTRTPVAVASVRGTDFSITSAGSVYCFEGAVAFYPAKDYNPSRVTSDAREDAPADEASAESTTPADEISSSAPVNAVVVGAGQTTKINSAGAAERPMSQAKKNAEKSKSNVKTAAEKETAVAAESKPVNVVQPEPEPDPAPVDPTPEDPTPVDPTPEDPTPVDPTPEDPTPVDPTPEDPTPVDPTPEDPTPVDPAPVDPTPEPPTTGSVEIEITIKEPQTGNIDVNIDVKDPEPEKTGGLDVSVSFPDTI